MHTNFKLILECVTPPEELQITIHDRTSILATVSNISQIETELNFKVLVPNQLTFVIEHSGSNPVILKKCSLGGLEIVTSMLNQICNFTPLGASDPIVTTNWWQDGKVVIDFFAGDWVQYHLLYGNKIIV
ncbi:hypothetical protein [Haliscomenobacter sp.]|uniref:hypothetical protein n=1 Tax=Haliscomenobacter sp. TaxID=2717303 RepID=UPI00336529FA